MLLYLPVPRYVIEPFSNWREIPSVTTKADQDPHLDPIDLVPWIRIRIRTEVNWWKRTQIRADPNIAKTQDQT